VVAHVGWVVACSSGVVDTHLLPRCRWTAAWRVNCRVVWSDLSTYPGLVRSLFRFPNPVNETAARIVATGAVIQCVAFLATRWTWLLVPLAFGFLARVASGPRFSPLGLLATRVIAPRLPSKLVAGPPKRFAQGIGASLSVGALVAAVLGATSVAVVLVAMIAAAATLEAVFAFCLGCHLFRLLMKVGVVPATVCEECNDISARLAAA
jgi:hypothetical protein